MSLHCRWLAHADFLRTVEPCPACFATPYLHAVLRLLMLVLWLGACTRPESPAGELLIAAASDLTNALPELVAAYERASGTPVRTTLGASGTLAQQIAHGAPVDVFLSADSSWIGVLERQSLIVPGTRAAYARGSLVLFTRTGLARADRLADLTRAEVQRVAIANPDHAPYGRAARSALQSAGVWDAVQPKLVLGDNVRQTLQFAETGNVDVAIIAHALVPGHERSAPVPDELHPAIVQELVLIAHRPLEAEAKRFREFVLGAEGRSILMRHGFYPPDTR
jgi:molybdate transport system substrate-binding protein